MLKFGSIQLRVECISIVVAIPDTSEGVTLTECFSGCSKVPIPAA